MKHLRLGLGLGWIVIFSYQSGQFIHFENRIPGFITISCFFTEDKKSPEETERNNQRRNILMLRNNILSRKNNLGCTIIKNQWIRTKTAIEHRQAAARSK